MRWGRSTRTSTAKVDLLLAPIAGLLYLGSWAAFLVFAYFAIKAIFWRVQKSNESLESWLIWGVAPFIVFGILRGVWAFLDY